MRSVEIVFFICIYFLLYPVGQVGFTAVTVLVVLPFMQVMVVFFAAKTGTTMGAGVATEVEEALGTGSGVAIGVGFTTGAGAS